MRKSHNFQMIELMRANYMSKKTRIFLFLLPILLFIYFFLFFFFNFLPSPSACVWSDTVRIGEIMRGVLPSVRRCVRRHHRDDDGGAYESAADAA